MTPNPNQYASEAFASADSIRSAVPSDVAKVLGKYGMTHPLLAGLDNESPLSHSADVTTFGLDPLAKARAAARTAKEARLGDAAELLGTPVFDAFERAHDSLAGLYGLSVNLSPHPDGFDRPLPLKEDPELMDQLTGLRDTFEAFQRAGLHPEIVISPEGLSLKKWQALFSSLRQWQDTHHPDSPHRLKNHADGDGLWFSSWVEYNWDALNTPSSNNPNDPRSGSPNSTKPRFTLWVIPGTPEPSTVNVAHDGTVTDGSVPPDLQKIIALTPRGKLEHPSISAYLTLQATRLRANESPIDSSDFDFTWLAGEKGGRALRGDWNSEYGRVGLYDDAVGERSYDLGARPAGRSNNP
jgi:hypothetical protein